MKKFKITEVQIDNFNETSNTNHKFDEGLNIICGPNEIGKSTLMDFIKNILLRKTDANGYIKCSTDDEEFNLRAEKNKKKDNDKFLENLSPHGFQTGFVINLDDIMFAKKAKAEELLNVIKDSSGNAINQKFDEYENFIYDSKKQRFALTSTKIATTSFKNQFNNLKKIEEKISQLKAKEEEYNQTCAEIETAENQITLLSEKDKCADLIIKKQQISDKLKNIKINTKLLEKKSDFENIRESFGALCSSNQNKSELITELEDNKTKLKEKIKELNTIQIIEPEEVNNFNITSEDIKTGKELEQKEYELNKEKENILSKIEDIEKDIKDYEFDLNRMTAKLNNFKINSFEEYKQDKQLLYGYKANQQELNTKEISDETIIKREKTWYKNQYFYLFSGLLLFSISMLIFNLHSDLKMPFIVFSLISFVGINTIFMESLSLKSTVKNSIKNQKKENEEDAIKLCAKYDFELKRGNKFIPQLEAFIQEMNDNLSEYKIIDNDIYNTRTTIEKLKNEHKKEQKNLAETEERYEDFQKKKTEFSEKISVKDISKLSEIYDILKDIKQLQETISDTEKTLDNTEKDIEDFVQKLNNFTQETLTDEIPVVNKYDYDDFNKILTEIRGLLDKCISDNRVISEYNSELEGVENNLKIFPEDMINELSGTDEDVLNNIKTELQNARDEKIRLLEKKNIIEQGENMVDLLNEKNAELNSLKNSLSKLFQKEMVYEIIRQAKEKFNETQPNLISAKEYFSKITNDKYDEIDFENKVISGKNTGEKDWDNLSRGTKEQLYLAFRLGYANNYSKDIEGNDNGLPNLPLIIDDAFVNFDSERTGNILKCLAEFSKNHQVLYFTCHSKTILDLLKKEKIKHNIIEL